MTTEGNYSALYHTKRHMEDLAVSDAVESTDSLNEIKTSSGKTFIAMVVLIFLIGELTYHVQL